MAGAASSDVHLDNKVPVESNVLEEEKIVDEYLLDLEAHKDTLLFKNFSKVERTKQLRL